MGESENKGAIDKREIERCCRMFYFVSSRVVLVWKLIHAVSNLIKTTVVYLIVSHKFHSHHIEGRSIRIESSAFFSVHS